VISTIKHYSLDWSECEQHGLDPETRARATGAAGTIRTDGAMVAAKLLLDAVSRESRLCPRDVEPGKVPGAGLHRQLGLLEETRILGGVPQRQPDVVLTASNRTGFQDHSVRSP
jgi:hypothetical protein